MVGTRKEDKENEAILGMEPVTDPSRSVTRRSPGLRASWRLGDNNPEWD